jgi:hypothetical protein
MNHSHKKAAATLPLVIFSPSTHTVSVEYHLRSRRCWYCGVARSSARLARRRSRITWVPRRCVSIQKNFGLNQKSISCFARTLRSGLFV